jgi:hypothetical protein
MRRSGIARSSPHPGRPGRQLHCRADLRLELGSVRFAAVDRDEAGDSRFDRLVETVFAADLREVGLDAEARLPALDRGQLRPLRIGWRDD